MRLFALMLVSILASVSQAQTRLTGNVAAGQTRTIQAGSYFVDAQILVYAGGKIIFQPGVNIEVRNSTFWIQIGGEAQFNGTSSQPITITTKAGTPSPGMVGMLPIPTGSTTRPKLSMNYTNFSSYNNNLIFARRADVWIENCNFLNTSSSATKSIFRAYENTLGSLVDCVLDLNNKTGYGLNVGQSATAADSTGIDLVNVAVLNSMQPVNIQKIAPIAILNGSID